ncbi:truncated transcription factor CAULIFLOWER A isoform X2 [Cryptomeria japonica]|uniref:truncated transcription factor CAULIFLOWER A isoform X2 n=1 Tax=Cryptomeria japonica TaxID=3369 RepID=UPI0025AD7A4F|nr:truncated transcription factor CAULIFLOWER A isoform X2 [Cryptomeria japonica]
MARAKLQLKTIENPVSRRSTFSKRKTGLLRKASEISILCDAEVALIIFSPSGKLYEFGSPSMNRIMEKYQKFTTIKDHTSFSETTEMLRLELENLRRRMKNLQNMYKHMIGDDLGSLSFKELKHLEKQISLGSRKLRSRKDKISVEYIGFLKNKVFLATYPPPSSNIMTTKTDSLQLGKIIGSRKR